MTRGFEGRLHPRHVRTIHNPNTNDDIANHTRAASKAHSLWECSKLSTGHQPREAERGRTLEEGLVPNPGDCSTYFVGRIRDTRQGRAKSRSKSRRRSLKPKHDRTSRSRFCILLHDIPYISLSMWASSNLRRPLLRRVIPKLFGLSCHHHQWCLPWSITNSQKGIARRSNSAILGRSPKLAQSIILCLSQGISTEGSTTRRPERVPIQCIFTFLPLYFLLKRQYKEV
jgi:hypothetical protein